MTAQAVVMEVAAGLLTSTLSFISTELAVEYAGLSSLE